MKKYNILTIERQYASGGSQIARELSDRLGIKCYGHELLELAADRIGMNKTYLSQIEESATSSMLYSFLMNPEASLRSADLIPPTDKLFVAESEIIKEIADREKCIFIGRAAGSVLEEREDCLRVFIYSDKETRLKRAVEEYLAKQANEEEIKKRAIEEYLAKQAENKNNEENNVKSIFKGVNLWEWFWQSLPVRVALVNQPFLWDLE